MDTLECSLVDDNIVEILKFLSYSEKIPLRLISKQWLKCSDHCVQKRPIHLLKEGNLISMIKQVQNPTKWKTHPKKLLNEIARRAHVGLFNFIITQYPTISFNSAASILTNTFKRDKYGQIRSPKPEYLDVKIEDIDNYDEESRHEIKFIDDYRRRFRILTAMMVARSRTYGDLRSPCEKDLVLRIASEMHEHEYIYRYLLYYSEFDYSLYTYVIYLSKDQADDCINAMLARKPTISNKIFEDIYSKYQSVGRKLAHLVPEEYAKRISERYNDDILSAILNPIAAAHEKWVADEELKKKRLREQQLARDAQRLREETERIDMMKKREQKEREDMFTKIKKSLIAAIKARGETLPVSFGFTMDVALAVDFNRPWTFATTRTKYEITVTRLYNL